MNIIKKIALCTMCFAITAIPSLPTVAEQDDISVEIDGHLMDFDVNPQIIDGRTMVPLRKIFEEIGALVKWDSDTQTISARKSSKTVTLKAGESELTINKGKTDENGNPVTETVTLEVPAQIISGRTLVPARAVSEAFGFNVAWDEKNQKVIISSENEDDSWKENEGIINLSNLTYSGDGVEISENDILIKKGGDFTLNGSILNGKITVSTDDKVRLRLNGISLTSSEGPCIYIENADKVYIILTENTDNVIISDNSENGAIYSKDNLEIKGNGNLTVTSAYGHAIKSSDNLTIENGNINLTAYGDGIHVNDTFKMTGGNLSITADGDGIDSESIVLISGGTLDIKTNGVPVSKNEVTNVLSDENTKHFPIHENNTAVEFEKSSKGINAEWMMSICGGTITVNSASHAIHCQDEIEISGGDFILCSEYEKGISAHGNLTVNNSETTINIQKSTEGMESKNILTVNDGTIKIIASDDGINATGGNSGDMFMAAPGGFGQHGNPNREKNDFPREREFNGDIQKDKTNDKNQMPEAPEKQHPPQEMPPEFNENSRPENLPGQRPIQENSGRKMSDCLIINGGDIEIYAEDDCLDSNGNLLINGGIVKATKTSGSFLGANAVIDPDGQTLISDEAVLILASGNGTEKTLNLSQNTVIFYGDKTYSKGDAVTLKDNSGNILLTYEPNGNYSSVLIASAKIKLGTSYTLNIGTDEYDIEISEQSTVIGTPTNNGFDRKNGINKSNI